MCKLQANKKEEPIDQVGKALETLPPFLDNFDENNDVTVLCGIHEEKNLTTIIQSLMCA